MGSKLELQEGNTSRPHPNDGGVVTVVVPTGGVVKSAVVESKVVVVAVGCVVVESGKIVAGSVAEVVKIAVVVDAVDDAVVGATDAVVAADG
jgi:hypothetical protein